MRVSCPVFGVCLSICLFALHMKDVQGPHIFRAQKLQITSIKDQCWDKNALIFLIWGNNAPIFLIWGNNAPIFLIFSHRLSSDSNGKDWRSRWWHEVTRAERGLTHKPFKRKPLSVVNPSDALLQFWDKLCSRIVIEVSLGLFLTEIAINPRCSSNNDQPWPAINTLWRQTLHCTNGV